MTTPTTTTFQALQDAKQDLIRKALEGVVCRAPMTVAVPTAITTGASSDLIALPTGFDSIGLVDKSAGVTWSRKPSTSKVTSWGFAEATRTDITSDERDIQFTAQETKLATLEMFEGVDLSSVTPDATTGEVSFASPQRPDTIYYRMFGLFVDGSGANTIYVGKLLPKANVTDLDPQKWTDGDDAIGYGVTLTANYDSDAGYSIRHFFGGPGWKALLTEMGFTTGG